MMLLTVINLPNVSLSLSLRLDWEGQAEDVIQIVLSIHCKFCENLLIISYICILIP